MSLIYKDFFGDCSEYGERRIVKVKIYVHECLGGFKGYTPMSAHCEDETFCKYRQQHNFCPLIDKAIS